ncbi:hypothetical protein Ancab_036236 [Ancistrocladus abbreviatus]
MSHCLHILSFLFSFTLVFTFTPPFSHPTITLAAAAAAANNGGSWQLLQNSIGISAMHMQLLNNDRVVTFDRTDFGRSNLSLPAGKCRHDPYEMVVKTDCTAHSAEYDVATNTFRPLMVQTDVWCSSGAVIPDGRLIQIGGFNDGDHVVRIFQPCATCDWKELGAQLINRRWYATNHILPDGRIIIIGGRYQFNYEFYPKSNLVNMPFLTETDDAGAENNLYPFVFLNVDGHLVIFANNRAILYDYTKSTVVKTYPTIPGGDPRNYPSTGSAVLLPLQLKDPKNILVEILVCGGAPSGSFQSAKKGQFVGALNTCGRISISDPNPQWKMETMPLARVMGDMLLLPNGQVIMINGAGSGTAAWELARNPVLSPVIYSPNNPSGSRFEVMTSTNIPRMYHSSAILLRDGRVLVGGSNPHQFYEFQNVLFPTELSLEAFSPPYLDPSVSNLRPSMVSPASQSKLGYGQVITVEFKIAGPINVAEIKVTMMPPSFTTHSFAMNQRLLILGGASNVKRVTKSTYQIQVYTPDSANLAPPGYYMMFVVHQEIPSQGIWTHIE